MNAEREPDDPAFDYYLEQIYDATRGHIAAYVIETADPDLVEMPGQLPTWQALTPLERWAFVDPFRDCIEPLLRGIHAVAEMHCNSTDNDKE